MGRKERGQTANQTGWLISCLSAVLTGAACLLPSWPALAEGRHLILSASGFYLSFNNTGVYRRNYSSTDMGLWGDAAYPLSQHFYIKGAAAFGFASDFQLFAGGFVYYFKTPGAFRTETNEQVNITTFAKWRPSLEALVGVNRTQTEVLISNRANRVNEDYYGGVLKGNLTYSWTPLWEGQVSAFAGSSGGNSASVFYYGLTAGVSFSIN